LRLGNSKDYSERDLKGSKEIFLVLHHTVDDSTIKESMMIHACAVMAGYKFEEFIEKLVDSEGIDFENPKLLSKIHQPEKENLIWGDCFSPHLWQFGRKREVWRRS